MNKNKIFNGDLIVKSGEVYDYEEITGYIYANEATKATFPKLTSVGGYIDARGATVDFPKLTSVGGYIDATGATVDFPKLTSVGGYICADGNTKATFPKLTKQNDDNAMDKCLKKLEKSFEKSGYSFSDGILSEIVQRKGNLYRVKICGKTKISYLVTDGNSWSHGKSLKEARDGLMFKIGNRNTSEFKSWNLDKIISKRDAIRAYRMITGACEQGVREWMRQRQTPDKISVKDLIKLTKNAYGNEAFEKFFTESV